MSVDLDKLKQVIPILNLATDLGLEVKGRQARCYNQTAHKHGDKHFSLGLDVKRNRYKCFTCKEQGSVIDLYKQVRGVEVGEAIKELSKMAGLTTPQTDLKPLKTPYKSINDTKDTPQEDLTKYFEVYEELCFLGMGLDEESEAYLKARGFNQDTLNRFCLFSIGNYQDIDKRLKTSFNKDILEKAGVVGEKGNLIFYKHKIVIPFISDGRITFLQGRRLDDGHPKYLHIKKPVPLFNADILEDLEKGDKVYICEGVLDAMILEQNGFNAVGILGVNNFKPEYLNLFKGLEVVLALDNDEAGREGIKELAKVFYLNGQGVKTKQLPEGIKDISDYFLSL